jgi:nitroimidazol reductase NimA-like FMN-containing flavoprotein (pyridoxamine 5'-phosphate oxidase superfamily)
VWVHGSAASRTLRTLGGGAPACLTVTLIDGLVLARAIFNHSMNYRSVIVLGEARAVTDPEDKRAALAAFAERIAPGRWADARPPTPQELKATSILALPLDEASAKVRAEPPVDDDADHALDVWAGVVPPRRGSTQQHFRRQQGVGSPKGRAARLGLRASPRLRERSSNAEVLPTLLHPRAALERRRRTDASRRELIEQELGGGRRSTGHGSDQSGVGLGRRAARRRALGAGTPSRNPRAGAHATRPSARVTENEQTARTGRKPGTQAARRSQAVAQAPGADGATRPPSAVART